MAGLIAAEPELLLLDEPTTGFDYAECMEMMAHVKRMNQAGTTVLMVCHDMEDVLDFAGRAIVLADGGVVADAPVPDVFSNQAVLERAALLPPQICVLSQRLAPAHPELAGMYGVDEMVDAVVASAKASKAATTKGVV